MKEVRTELQYELYDSPEELKTEDRNLLNEALKATESAYAPYSGFLVGAAVLLENDVVVTGSNQENAAYPSGLCAERVALFSAASHHPGVKIKAIAITARLADKQALLCVSPCGDCRQVMAECEHRYNNGIRLIMTAGQNRVMVFNDVKQLLPIMFNAGTLRPQ